MKSETVPDARRARVEVLRKPMWRVRLGRGLPRLLLAAAAVFGLAASARFAIDPPPAPRPAGAPTAPAVDRGAEGYAVLFVRRYLTWNASEPGISQRSLEPFIGPQMEAGAGLGLPSSGEQQVQWAEVVQAREPEAGLHVYTVAAQTDSAGLLYLSVSVERTAAGGVALAGYPAFVGAPASVPATTASSAGGRLREVEEAPLRIVVERALRNYLAGSGSELDADLATGARVSLPAMALTLQTMQRLAWSEPNATVVAVVQARDARGTQYVLAYELQVVRAQGRWEIAAVQTDPNT